MQTEVDINIFVNRKRKILQAPKVSKDKLDKRHIFKKNKGLRK